MISLNLPSYSYKIKELETGKQIFDSIRKKYVKLTPEEWVRQHFIHYLVHYKHYSASLISVEHGMQHSKGRFRSDVLIHNNKAEVIMLVECKAASVKINQEVFDQIVNYNIRYRAPYLSVTNGMKHYCCQVDYTKKSIQYLKEIPDYRELYTNNNM